MTALRSLGVPVVAATHGKLIGGGIAVLTCADYVVAAAEATFEHGNLVRGVCPIGGYTARLPHAVGPSRALRMYLTNETIGADQACAIRLVHEVQP
uniref:Enoyl-CoA hydratase n=1 Tax=Emiliania huxleyi (strain CCMP1516) TaxID=280463 RepID=A0A0D3JHQ8_EMIH1